MKNKIRTGARIVLGLIFFVFGLNGFLNLIPVPMMQERAADFLTAMANTGYFIPFFKVIETICGALLIFNLYVPFILVLLTPIVINIVLFHLFLDVGGVILGAINFALLTYLAYSYRNYYTKLLTKKAKPS